MVNSSLLRFKLLRGRISFPMSLKIGDKISYDLNSAFSRLFNLMEIIWREMDKLIYFGAIVYGKFAQKIKLIPKNQQFQSFSCIFRSKIRKSLVIFSNIY